MGLTDDVARHDRELADLTQLQAMVDQYLVDNDGELILRAGVSSIALSNDGIALIHRGQRIDLEQIAKMWIMFQWLQESTVLPPNIEAQLASNSGINDTLLDDQQFLPELPPLPPTNQ